MATERIGRVACPEQDPATRAHNFDEVCLGYTPEQAVLEAGRCLHCKNPRCVAACPVGVDIPDFIAAVKEGDNARRRTSLRATRHSLQFAEGYVLRRPSVKAVACLESDSNRLL